MKNLICIVSLLFLSNFLFGGDQDNWFEISLPDKAEQSPYFNLIKKSIDAPAGKHGFLKSKGKEFIFKDGTKATFWGTNLCFGACFPEKNQAEKIAAKIAMLGYNAIRLHHMDYSTEPTGIFQGNGINYNLSVISKTQLDKLDYFIYQLKRHGVYVNINLLVSRHFSEYEGFKNNGLKKYGHSSVSLFDNSLIKLQKRYAKKLLTHFNPYTKLKYYDDPAIAFVEITNENSLFHSWEKEKLNPNQFAEKRYTIPNYYINQLDQLWNRWLKKSYSQKLNRLQLHVNMKKKEVLIQKNRWRLNCLEDAKAVLSNHSNGIKIEVLNINSIPWHVQYSLNNLKLKKGKKYLFEFKASANNVRNIGVCLQQCSEPYSLNGLSQNIVLTKKIKSFKLPFIYEGGDESNKLSFILGNEKRMIFISDMKLFEINHMFLPKQKNLYQRPRFKNLKLFSVQIQKDIKNFYFDLQSQYVKEMTSFIKKVCKIQVPMTAIAGNLRNLDIKSQKKSDFIDVHTYWDHPQFPNYDWNLHNFKINNNSVLEKETSSLIEKIKEKDKYADSLFKKPFTITEWDHCFPNQFAYETPLLIASHAIKNGWDALFHFNFSSGFKNKTKKINNYFESFDNPSKLILNSLASRLYLKANNIKFKQENNIYFIKSDIIHAFAGNIKNKLINFDKFSLKSNINGVLAIYPLDGKTVQKSKKILFLIMGEIKNSNSYWNEKGKYIWGNLPVKHKHYELELQFKEQNIKLFSLDDNLNAEKEIVSKSNIYTFDSNHTKTVWYQFEFE